MLNQKPACWTGKPFSAQKISHVRSLSDSPWIENNDEFIEITILMEIVLNVHVKPEHATWSWISTGSTACLKFARNVEHLCFSTCHVIWINFSTCKHIFEYLISKIKVTLKLWGPQNWRHPQKLKKKLKNEDKLGLSWTKLKLN